MPGLDGLPASELPLYLSEKLSDYSPDKPLFLVEGEPAADALLSIGAQVVGTALGAPAAPSPAVLATLTGFKDLVLWPDLDAPGRKQMRRCAEILVNAPSAGKLRILDPEGIGLTEPGADAVEWLEAYRASLDGAGEPEIREGLSRAAAQHGTPYEPEDRYSCETCYSNEDPDSSGAIDDLPSCDSSEEPMSLSPDQETPYPLAALPPELRQAAEGIHELTRAPLALCAQSVLAVACLAAQRLADVELPTGQASSLSLFFVSVAQSGERKSTVDRWAMAPLEEEERRQETAYRESRAQFDAELEAWKLARSAAKREEQDSGAVRERLLKLGPEPKAPPQPGLLVTMGTLEGILSMLEDRDSVGLFSDEGGGFLAGYAMAKENDRRTRTAAVFSSLWDGKAIREERRGGKLRLGHSKRASMHLLVQPVVAEKLLGDEGLEGQGLLSRVLVVEPESTMGTRQWREPAPWAREAVDRYSERVRELLEGDSSERQKLQLSDEARRQWIALHDEIETQLGPSGDLDSVRSFAAKAAEHACRIAGVLAVFEDPSATEIASLGPAVDLIRFYLSERLRLVGKLAEPYAEDAALVAKWIHEKWEEKYISISDLLQRGPGRFRRKRKLLKEKILPLLLEYGHLKGPPTRATIREVTRREAYGVVRKASSNSHPL